MVALVGLRFIFGRPRRSGIYFWSPSFIFGRPHRSRIYFWSPLYVFVFIFGHPRLFLVALVCLRFIFGRPHMSGIYFWSPSYVWDLFLVILVGLGFIFGLPGYVREQTLPTRTNTTTENMAHANLSGYNNRQIRARVCADPDPWWQWREEWLCSPDCHHLCLAFATLPKQLPSMMSFPDVATSIADFLPALARSLPHVRHEESANSSISMRAQRMLILTLSTLLSTRI